MLLISCRWRTALVSASVLFVLCLLPALTALAETPVKPSSSGTAEPCCVGSEIGPSTHIGESLRRALDRYESFGINVVSASSVLPSKLTVTVLPSAGSSLVDQIQQLLAPHELRLVMVDTANGYVTPASRRAPKPELEASATIEGEAVIEEIVVTSYYRMRRADSLGSATALLDHEELLLRPSLGRDPLRGLRGLPGIASSGVSARHEFRGGSANETLYRLDGVELLEPFHLGNLQALFSAVNLNVVESADVYTAGFPVSLGTRLSGVVDLNPIEPEPGIEAGIDVNMITAGADVAYGDDHWGMVGAFRQSLLQRTLSLFERDFGEPRFHDEYLRVTFNGDASEWVVGALRSSDKATAIDRNEQGRSDTDYQSLWLRWRRDSAGGSASEWQLNLTDIDNSRAGVLDEPLMAVGALQERRRFSTVRLANLWRIPVRDDLVFESGWSYAHQRGDFAIDLTADYGVLAVALQGASDLQRQSRIKRSGESIAGFASLSARLSPRLKLESGVRYDAQDIDPVHSNDLSARVALEFAPTGQVDIALNVGRYVQQQHLYEIQIDDGKAELDPPQLSDQANLTIQWRPHSRLRLRSDFYYRDVTDPWSHVENVYNRWVLLPELAGDRVEIIPSAARSYGIELQISGELGRQWSWQASYALARSEESYFGKSRPRPWQQEHGLKAGLKWRAQRWRLGLTADYHSGRPTTALVTSAGELAGELYADQLPDFFSLDMHLSREVVTSRGQLEAYLDITNLTNRDNVGGFDYARGTHQQQLLGLTPVLGLSWRW